MLRLSTTWDSPVFGAAELFLINTSCRKKTPAWKSSKRGNQVGTYLEKVSRHAAPLHPVGSHLARPCPRPRCSEGQRGAQSLNPDTGVRASTKTQDLCPTPLGAAHAPLRRAAASPPVVFLPINLTKAIKELQHLQPSPSCNSSGPEGVSREQSTSASRTAPLWDATESKDGELLLWAHRVSTKIPGFRPSFPNEPVPCKLAPSLLYPCWPVRLSPVLLRLQR